MEGKEHRLLLDDAHVRRRWSARLAQVTAALALAWLCAPACALSGYQPGPGPNDRPAVTERSPAPGSDPEEAADPDHSASRGVLGIPDEQLDERLAAMEHEAQRRLSALADARRRLNEGQPRWQVIEPLRDAGLLGMLGRGLGGLLEREQRGPDEAQRERGRRGPGMGERSEPGPGQRGPRPAGAMGPPGGLDPWATLPQDPQWSPQKREAFVREHLPEFADRLSSPPPEVGGEIGARLLERLDRRMSEISALMSEDREHGELKLRELKVGLGFVGLAAEARRAQQGGADMAELTSRFRPGMRALLEEGFEVRLALTRHQHAQWQARARELAAEIDRLVERRDAIIDEQVERAIEQARRSIDGDARERRPSRDQR